MIEKLIAELKDTDAKISKFDGYEDYDNTDLSEYIGYRTGLEFALELLGVEIERDYMDRITKIEIKA